LPKSSVLFIGSLELGFGEIEVLLEGEEHVLQNLNFQTKYKGTRTPCMEQKSIKKTTLSDVWEFSFRIILANIGRAATCHTEIRMTKRGRSTAVIIGVLSVDVRISPFRRQLKKRLLLIIHGFMYLLAVA
jgi:hypothetical protein